MTMNPPITMPAETKAPDSFRVEFSIHMRYDKGETSFRREEQLPFVPFIGLDVLDNALGEFSIKHVAWASGCKMFLCQSNVEHTKWTIREACKAMKKSGWTEDKESRQSDS
jgi:hypothetical protein